MKLTIDNLNGSGPLDYTGSILAGAGLTLKRSLNAPSTCTFTFLPAAQGLPLPVRYAFVTVFNDPGLTLFTGYVSAPPETVGAGEGFAGRLATVVVEAISDEVLLDSTLSVTRMAAVNQSALQTLQLVTGQTGGSSFSVSPSSTSSPVGRYEVGAATNWSSAAAALGTSTRSAYRVVGGVVQMAPSGSTTHTLSELSGTLQVGGLTASAVKLLANDVTVCGSVEPAAYVMETFAGDGVTVKYTLTEPPFEPIKSARLTITDLFQEPSLDPQIWQWVDSSSRLSITSQGLTCSGGSGQDSETTVSALQQVELGGGLVLEAGGVQLQPGSSGLLLGLYFGSVSRRNCMAGFSVSSANGTTQIAPIVDGALAGSVFSLVAGHLYTFRTRLFCYEMGRVTQSYYFLGAGGIGSQGGQYVMAGGRLVLEVQDVTSGVPGVPIVLFDGSIGALPPSSTLGLLDSGDLMCSIKTLSCKQGAPLWATLTPSGGTPASLHIGTTSVGGVCSLSSAGLLTFYSSSIPPAGSLITVLYRTRNRAVSRRSNGVSSASPAPATQMWIGTVREPVAWSSTDCDNAALALLQSSAAASAAWKGTYTATNLDLLWDVWPGDVLAITSPSNNIQANVVVREVQIETGSSAPQSTKYVVRFANDWAEDLALKLSSSIPEDVWLPQQPIVHAPLLSPGSFSVTAITGSQIQVSTNISPPLGGGFEVKRRDWTFGPGTDSDLVMRSPVSNFIIPRVAPVEQYYIRMYDGASPPNYSQFSAAVFVNVPL
jgi:hypothetical protein